MTDLLNPEMPAQQLRLHMGELSASEIRVARAAIAWANGAAQAQTAEVRRETIAECAKKSTSFLVGDPFNGVPLSSPSPHQIADAIRALTDAAKEDRP